MWLPWLPASHASALQAALEDVEDLEADARPEDLMMSYVSGEKGKVQRFIFVIVFPQLFCRLSLAQSCSTSRACMQWWQEAGQLQTGAGSLQRTC